MATAPLVPVRSARWPGPQRVRARRRARQARRRPPRGARIPRLGPSWPATGTPTTQPAAPEIAVGLAASGPRSLCGPSLHHLHLEDVVRRRVALGEPGFLAPRLQPQRIDLDMQACGHVERLVRGARSCVLAERLSVSTRAEGAVRVAA